MSENHVSPEFVDSAIAGLQIVTQEDEKIARINTLTLFKQIRVLEVRNSDEWNPEPLLTQLKPETLQKLSELFDPVKIDETVAKGTDMNILGKYVHNFAKEMQEGAEV